MTAPTANPVPSAAPQDLLYNAEQIDKVVNSSEATYPDRFGVQRLTLAGAVDTIRAINVRGAWASGTSYAPKDVVSNSGTWYIAIDTHTAGASFAGDLAAHWRVYQGVVASDLAGYATEAEGAGLVGFDPTLNYAAATIGAALRYSIVYPHLFPWLAPTDGSDAGPAIRACIAANPGRTIYLSRKAGDTYTISSSSGGAYLTLSGAGTRLTGDPSVKLLFTDAAVYGVNITGHSCIVDKLFLWGTNTTAPTITAMVHVDGPYCSVDGNNIAYAANGVHVDGTYIAKIFRNRYSNCDRFFYVTGSCADIKSRDNTYGTTHIGTNPAVEILAPGVSIDDEWEMQDQTKLALSCGSGSQRVEVRGKMLDSGGVSIAGTTHVRYDVIMHSSYTGTAGITVGASSTLDATGAYLLGPGITSGVTAIVSDGALVMGSGVISKWQLAGDINGIVSIGDVVVSQCTTPWDIATAATGKIGPCTYSGVTNPVTRTSSSVVNLVDAWSGKQAWTPGLIAAGGEATVTIAVTGIRAGDDALVTYDQDQAGGVLSWQVLANSIVVRLRNHTGGGITPVAGNLRWKVSGNAA